MSRIIKLCLILLLLGLWLLLPLALLPRTSFSGTEDALQAPLPSPREDTASPAVSAEPVSSLPYRAVWISYLEWQHADFSSEDAFTSQVSGWMQECVDLGLNVAIVQVRPFGDALYPSELFPFSHLCTGTQGQDPGFDPLSILIEQAHSRGLEVEAWINPYRIQSSAVPSELADNSVAELHPDWVKTANSGLWLDPANEDVQAYIADGIRELCRSYDVDGIHFDDYFYPTTDTDFDAEQYDAYRNAGGTLEWDDWRRENVSALVSGCYDAAHEYGVRFGISPQGNLQNNYDSQYSDVARWLNEPGFVDYLMPQVYWGLTYYGGSNSLAFENCVRQWLDLPRLDTVALYVGLGAYRIGDGDGSDASDAEWNSGHALANQAECLQRNQINGFALYRFDSLFGNAAWPELAQQELESLRELCTAFGP